MKLFWNICEWLLFFVIRSVFDNTNKNFNGKPWIVYAAIKRRSKWFCKIYIFFDLRWVFNSKPLFESNPSHSYETVITRKASLSNKSIDKIWNKWNFNCVWWFIKTSGNYIQRRIQSPFTHLRERFLLK